MKTLLTVLCLMVNIISFAQNDKELIGTWQSNESEDMPTISFQSNGNLIFNSSNKSLEKINTTTYAVLNEGPIFKVDFIFKTSGSNVTRTIPCLIKIENDNTMILATGIGTDRPTSFHKNNSVVYRKS
ncbi:hypothetical protein GCM10009117_17130 [Gangjinia marincola]|uniref:DUF5004 domain-containing protein n=1 Tax=Gangjinia marincola TaxID=578463 RepID=A0ABP3XT34_9FLAO